MPRSRFPCSQEFKLRSISKTGDKDKFFVSMLKDGKIQLAEYSLADFQARNFANPLRCFTADDRVLLPSQTIIAYQKEKLILTNGAKLDRWDIRQQSGIRNQAKTEITVALSYFQK